MWTPERTVFDMGRSLILPVPTGILQRRLTEFAFDVVVPAYGGVILNRALQWNWMAPNLMVVAAGDRVHLHVVHGHNSVTKMWQPVVDGQTTFVLPSGENLRVRVA